MISALWSKCNVIQQKSKQKDITCGPGTDRASQPHGRLGCGCDLAFSRLSGTEHYCSVTLSKNSVNKWGWLSCFSQGLDGGQLWKCSDGRGKIQPVWDLISGWEPSPSTAPPNPTRGCVYCSIYYIFHTPSPVTGFLQTCIFPAVLPLSHPVTHLPGLTYFQCSMPKQRQNTVRMNQVTAASILSSHVWPIFKS